MAADDSPTFEGFRQPTDKGSFFGQCKSYDKRVPTGQTLWIKRVDETTGEDDSFRLKVKEKRSILTWIWDGQQWLTRDQFEKQYHPKVKATTHRVLVSKHDYDALGNKLPTRKERK